MRNQKELLKNYVQLNFVLNGKKNVILNYDNSEKIICFKFLFRQKIT